MAANGSGPRYRARFQSRTYNWVKIVLSHHLFRTTTRQSLLKSIWSVIDRQFWLTVFLWRLHRFLSWSSLIMVPICALRATIKEGFLSHLSLVGRRNNAHQCMAILKFHSPTHERMVWRNYFTTFASIACEKGPVTYKVNIIAKCIYFCHSVSKLFYEIDGMGPEINRKRKSKIRRRNGRGKGVSHAAIKFSIIGRIDNGAHRLVATRENY